MRRRLGIDQRLGIDPRIGLACLLVACACAASYGGLFSHAYPGDTSVYQGYGAKVVHGHQIPYRDFFIEYPPGAIPVFMLPEVASDAHYLILFKLFMTACAIGFTACAGWICRRLGLGLWRLAPIVVAPLLMGPVFLNRFDPAVALISSLALIALLRARERTSGVLLAVATAVKLYPLVVVPIALRRLRPVRRAVVAFVVTSAIFWLPFLALAPGGVRFSLKTQLERHLQIESLGSSLLLAGSKLGIHHVHWIEGFGSIDLGGRLPGAVGTTSSLLVLILILLVSLAYWRGADDDSRLVTAWAAATAAFVVFGKVLSPQYLTWLVAVVPLAAGRRGLWAAGALVAAMALSMPEYLFWGRHGVRNQNWTVWLLLLRNGLLVTSFWFLYSELRQGERFAKAS